METISRMIRTALLAKRPVAGSAWEYQSLDLVPGRIQPSYPLSASSEIRLLNRTVGLCW
jgi:hypothetical protein